MPALDHSAATLRILGADLNPNEITKLLGGLPTDSAFKGEIIIGKHSGQKRTAVTGRWALKAPEAKPGDLDSQVRHILGQLTADLEIWRNICAKYRVDLFCGLFMGSTNDGLSLSAETLSALGLRGIKLDLDIYDASP